jgi:pimeloyl-[acyl-carrier protein] methyl ester esterase
MKPWVLLHGWGFHSAIWGDLASPRPSRDVRLIDLPGHGSQAARPFTTLDALADEIAPQLPPGALVGGWSLGGLVAQRLARRHPDRVGALALIAATPCFLDRDDWPHGVPAATLAAFASDLRRDARATLARFVNLNAIGGESGREAARAATRRLAERPLPSPDALDAALALLSSTDLRADARTLTMPAVVIHGARDRIVPVGAGRWLAQALATARLVELPAAAHLPFVSHREAVRDALVGLDA